MCGIFGLSIAEDAAISPRAVEATLHDLFLYSESRGKEASGLAVLDTDQIRVLKSAIAASEMVRSDTYRNAVRAALKNGNASANGNSCIPATFIGHSRLVTTGSQHDSRNNQPVVAGRVVGIHNGIIVNHEELWKRHPDLDRQYDVDTEVALCLLRKFYDETGDLLEATRRTFQEVQGATSIAVFFEELDALVLATNNGSLYRCTSPDNKVFLFGSERHIVERVAERPQIRKLLAGYDVHHIPSGTGCILNTRDLTVQKFSFDGESREESPQALMATPRTVVELDDIKRKRTKLNVAQRTVGLSGRMDDETRGYLDEIEKRFPHESTWQDSLRRCTRCILPETMPFIEFDDAGVCNYCRNYQKIQVLGTEQLEARVAPHRGTSSEPDCVVGVSGGRDSIHSLHYVKNVLKMNPIAYTYDWGMVTDLARRNISRICGKLGIEHVLVSADITRKRLNVKRNVTAWLKKPNLGMIPLFMAGDKQYFFYLQQVRKQTGVELTVLGENMLERTDFKTGFAGVRPYNADSKHVYTLPLSSKAGLFSFYGKEYLTNPGYINASLFDTAFAAACYYAINRKYLNLYNYIPWEEEVIVPTLIDEYDFELSPDTKTTWRIGDGTAAFYNYIYYNVAGFTENETFRSNQIREGYITREDAMQRVRTENQPRYETILWYLRIIDLDLDMAKVLEIIHAIPRIATLPRK